MTEREVELAWEIVDRLDDEDIHVEHSRVMEWAGRIYRRDSGVFQSAAYIMGSALDDNECWEAMKRELTRT